MSKAGRWTIETVDTDRLRIGYLDEGPREGRPVLLLHGFPDDAGSYGPVLEQLTTRGFRCVAPYVRGVGPTTFLERDTPRAGGFATLAQDALDLFDRLGLNDATIVGQDWGSPTAEIVAFMRPERVTKLVKLNWYGVYTMAEMAKARGFDYDQLSRLWYVWMLNLELGKMALDWDRLGFCERLWTEWSPTWDAGERHSAFQSASVSFAGNDYARVVLSTYRDGIAGGEVDAADDPLRARVKAPPAVACDTVVLRGADDGVERMPLDESLIPKYFTGRFRQEVLAGVGHFPHREAPEAVVRAIESAV